MRVRVKGVGEGEGEGLLPGQRATACTSHAPRVRFVGAAGCCLELLLPAARSGTGFVHTNCRLLLRRCELGFGDGGSLRKLLEQ